ncbi:hypothetical protein [Aurantibacillus circumpalustris]|uniref:hypothetical protein n=1 Tax=Aurantibacillus circumpalustris TaxID=3036359 RepID=UPI00295B2740|nr:hypothetical protein [Aurantibacillus circumpalustris]
MSKLVFIALFFILFYPSFYSQKTEQDLVTKIWYCSCDFNSDNFSISGDNTNQPATEIKFSPSGKVILKNLKKRNADSSFTYFFKKNSLSLKSDLIDSVKTLNYNIKKPAGKKAYDFSLKYSSRYVRKKGDDAIIMDKVVLKNGKKRKVIREGDEIAVFSQCKALRNDSINRAVWGVFVGYISDTLILESDQYVEHNFYKKYTDTLHYIAPLLLDTSLRIKIPIKYITGIYNQREPLSSISSNATLFGMAVGFAGILASVSAGEVSSAGTFAQIGVFSFLTIPISLSVNVIFSKQKFQINSKQKPKKNWIIERHMPHTMITQNSKKLKKKNKG